MSTIRTGKTTHVRPTDARHAIRPIPCASAQVVVTIDGSPYAGFANRQSAEEALELWSGEASGAGLPISARVPRTRGWPAVRGHVLAIVER